MRFVLYSLAVVLVICWIFGFFFGQANHLIHVLLVLAAASVWLGVIRKAKV